MWNGADSKGVKANQLQRAWDSALVVKEDKYMQFYNIEIFEEISLREDVKDPSLGSKTQARVYNSII